LGNHLLLATATIHSVILQKKYSCEKSKEMKNEKFTPHASLRGTKQSFFLNEK